MCGAYPTMKQEQVIRMFVSFKKANKNKLIYSFALLINDSPIFNLPVYSMEIKDEYSHYEIDQLIIIKAVQIIVASKDASQIVSLIIYLNDDLVSFDWQHQYLKSTDNSKNNLWKKIQSIIDMNSIHLTISSASILNEVY